jgi:hypothetical protein
MNQQTSGAMDTQYIPVPAGDYSALIDDVKPRKAKDSTILDISWLVGADQVVASGPDEGKTVQQVTGLPKNTVRQSIFLDLTAEGFLDVSKGKNVQLGALREALGQNDPQRPWGPGMLKGQMATVAVSHRMAEDGSGKIYTDVKNVRKVG